MRASAISTSSRLDVRPAQRSAASSKTVAMIAQSPLLRLIEDFLRRHRDDLRVFRHEMSVFDQLHEFGLDLARDEFANAAVLVDVTPFADQVEMVRVLAVAAEHAILHLRRRAVERVIIAVIELVEQLDEFIA